MASGFFALLDDIAALMDDVAVAAKVATKKTAAILGDDLAVNAEKATGFLSSREIPVLWQITKGAIINKIIIVPIIFLLQWIYPPAITIILIIGGFYLAYEGVEKIIHAIFHKKEDKPAIAIKESMTEAEMLADEKTKVKSAIITDFILSIEIVIIALSNVLESPLTPLTVQILAVSVVAIIAVVGVYGVVALIVKMDDLGYRFIKSSNGEGLKNTIGNLLVKALPIVIKTLAIIGTIALLLVSGGIFDHNIDYLHHLLKEIPETLKHLLYGVIAGLLAVIIVTPILKIFGKKSENTAH